MNMKHRLITAALLALCGASLYAQERLDRGAVALPASGGGMFLSWRLLASDAADVSFAVERDGKVLADNLTKTCFVDRDGKAGSVYRVLTATGTSAKVMPWRGEFLSVQLNKPDDGDQCTYSPNDCSVGDVDGDGQYELFVKWDPSNSHDNAHNGYTGEVFIDCYKIKWDGATEGALTSIHLWRVSLGPNIRAGAHYTQFLVYDFDGDGRAELMCKTAPGSIDGVGHYVSQAATQPDILSTDDAADYRNENGRILSGPEFLTVFEGNTGRALHTVYYYPNRGLGFGGDALYGEWGDKPNLPGNRGERFLACAAHLDGMWKPASAIFARGYYTRAYLWALDFDGTHLHTRWVHASTSPNSVSVIRANGKSKTYETASAYGQGAHSIAVADVDGDGYDEITFGSAAIDHDGSMLYSTKLGHGDALHLSDLDPDRPGLEVFMVHEEPPFGSDLRDAKTGEIIWRETGNRDTGRGLAADIDAAHRGCELWSSVSSAIHDVHGNNIAEVRIPNSFRIYWDGDLQEELLGSDRRTPAIVKWDGSASTTIARFDNSATCNGSKATPCLQADLLGDWREELIFFDPSDRSRINIFTTNIPTDYRVTTLMQDHVYRLSVVWQNVGYNQPPHLGYYLPDKARKAE